MQRTQHKRLQKVESAIRALPIAPEVVRNAYLHFQATGELPDDQRVAGAVVRRCKSGRRDDDWKETPRWGVVVMSDPIWNTPPRLKDDVMDALYDEAVWGDGMVRGAARHLLVSLSDLGADVTEPVYAKSGIEIALPEWGSVGLHLLGMPECLAVPPYEEQAQRLFARYDVLRERVDQDDRRWFEDFASAVGMFHEQGELPGDELLRECVLADGEFRCLLAHNQGAGDAEVMAAFDGAAVATGVEREVAIARVQEMGRGGRLLSVGEPTS